MAKIYLRNSTNHELIAEYNGESPLAGMGIVISGYPNDNGELGELVGVVDAVTVGMYFDQKDKGISEYFYQVTLKSVYWRPSTKDSNVPPPTP